MTRDLLLGHLTQQQIGPICTNSPEVLQNYSKSSVPKIWWAINGSLCQIWQILCKSWDGPHFWEEAHLCIINPHPICSYALADCFLSQYVENNHLWWILTQNRIQLTRFFNMSFLLISGYGFHFPQKEKVNKKKTKWGHARTNSLSREQGMNVSCWLCFLLRIMAVLWSKISTMISYHCSLLIVEPVSF